VKNQLAKIVTVLMVAGFVTAGSTASAVSEGDNPENSEAPQLSTDLGDMEKLNLTPEQRKKIVEYQEAARQGSGGPLREQFRETWNVIYSMAAKPGTTQADMSSLMEEINAIQAQLVARRVKRLFAMREILTPEQFAKMQEMETELTDEEFEGGEEKSQEPAQS